MMLMVTNDDGVDAPGLVALANAVSHFGEVWTVAPLHEQSGLGHSVTLHTPLRVDRRGPQCFAVGGTPTDCMFLAIHALLPTRPKIVFCGINCGANLGDDVHYSGTIGASIEAGIMGISALAVSLAIDRSSQTEPHWETAAAIAQVVARDLLELSGPLPAVLNLNVPDVPKEAVKGMRVCPLGMRKFTPRVDERKDLFGRPYWWIAGKHDGFRDIPGSDGLLLLEGYATLSPLRVDMTDHEVIDNIQKWPCVSEADRILTLEDEQ